MCGKALPDLVKQTKPVGASGSAIVGGGIGTASRPSTPTTNTPTVSPPIVPPVIRPTPAPRAENPNRDLSYLLHDDDHVPAKTSRAPFIVAGLILAAVAGFFYLRGSSKPMPSAGSGSGDATASQATPPAGTDGAPSEGKVEPPKGETTKAEASKTEPATTAPAADVPKTEPEKADISPAAAAPVAPAPVAPAPVKDTHHPAQAVAMAHPKPTARPAHQQKKPSPAKAAAPEADSTTVADTPSATSGNCEAQLPAMRKAAARGDAKAKADLGLVYYAGRCVPRDLPTAYHWYALALRTAPDSPQISAQLEAIWKQMSPAERQLALKAQ